MCRQLFHLLLDLRTEIQREVYCERVNVHIVSAVLAYTRIHIVVKIDSNLARALLQSNIKVQDLEIIDIYTR